MISTILKLIALGYVNNRVTKISDNLKQTKEGAADYIESRAQFIRNNLMQDLERMGDSLFGFISVAIALFFSGLVTFMWLFAVAWNSQYREYILVAAILLPLIIGLLLFKKISNSWKKETFMNDSMILISEDWNKLRYDMDSKAANKSETDD
jgi:hypothetical protein